MAAETGSSSGVVGNTRFRPEANKLEREDHAIHDWYRFVLSYPAHMVRKYLNEFAADSGSIVLDPFCGTGTTLVEAKKHGIGCIGIEAHPMTSFAAKTKVNWDVNVEELHCRSQLVYRQAMSILDKQHVPDDPQMRMVMEASPSICKTLSQEQMSLLLKGSISPLPLHKVLVLSELIDEEDYPVRDLMRLALARELVSSIGNLHFGPEVGVTKPKLDVPVVNNWRERMAVFADDLSNLFPTEVSISRVINADSRQVGALMEPASVDFVITSPPYPNEKDYTRTTRLESVILGFISTKAGLRDIKQGKLLRSNTRNVYKDDADDRWIASNRTVQEIASQIEARRIELRKTSGFERLYHRVTRLYFGGMARHLAELRAVLKPGARLAYVVGDQASYLRVMIRTGELLAEIAQELGYELERIDLFRTRLATATKAQLREEVVLLRWPG